MTQFEFETRTKVNVTADEFETIHNFYMSCEANKDEFCKMWVKMNPGRVTAARIAAKEAARREADLRFAERIYNRFCGLNLHGYADDYLTESEFDRLEGMGINPGLVDPRPIFARVIDVRFQLQKKFGFN